MNPAASRHRDRIIGFLSPIALLMIWELVVRSGLMDRRFFPAPSSVMAALWSLTESGMIFTHAGASLGRLFQGVLLGGIPGLAIGLAMGLYRPVRAAIRPIVFSIYPIPKSALLPLIFLIFGLGEMSKVVIVAIGAFFPIVINTTTGVIEIPGIYRDVGRNFGASRWNTFRTIALPGALPVIMTGVKLGIGMGLILISIAEMVGAKSGLGYMIWNSWEIYAIETMYAGLFVIALIGFAMTAALDWLEKIVVPWKTER